jgi:hypothetical protein
MNFHEFAGGHQDMVSTMWFIVVQGMVMKIEQLENEMKNLIIRNNELSNITKFYQANIKRISKCDLRTL